MVKPGPCPGVEVRAVDEPATGRDDVLLRIDAASVCGTDRELLEWTPSAAAFGLRFPVVMGHEAAGTVIETGPDVAGLRPGDRVALESHLACGVCHPCRTGDGHNCAALGILGMHLDGVFAERVAVPERLCYPLPDGIGPEVGALLEPAGVAWHAVDRSEKAVAGGTVLVSGCGPVGLVIVQLSLLLGATTVLAVEPNPYRRRLAASLGATAVAPDTDVVDLARTATGARGGVDVAFEVSAAPGVLPVLFEAVRREGTVVTIGHPADPAEIDIAAHVNKKGVTLRGVFGRRLWDTWEHMTALVSAGRLDLSWLITHRLPLEALPDAVELLGGDAAKILLLPDEA
ncbi:alcohol dehydrogenase catalytic domain-containing protein [Actinomycetospora endophytica]|uniref:Alcohol dehydrogenase catalytic domain-containing protein n=1 Tax=Actinomycetospora endophytica TaxID=2291215 RepID=A0ABS8P0Z5_9PSEU|nr:alcohol dehydrogenase catalytic domain-containing protein [Actinomycetospora endophytica]MCD2191924.1 alcohol dehydrogenase catalytic domain-containing protein [Actinomycetospora endophytica]